MQEWITNIDSRTLMYMMCREYFINKIIEIIHDKNEIHNRSSVSNYSYEFCIEITENSPQKIDNLIKEKLFENGFNNYIDVNFRLCSVKQHNYLDLVIKITFKKDLTKNDIESINGFLLLLGYGDKI